VAQYLLSLLPGFRRNRFRPLRDEFQTGQCSIVRCFCCYRPDLLLHIFQRFTHTHIHLFVSNQPHREISLRVAGTISNIVRTNRSRPGPSLRLLYAHFPAFILYISEAWAALHTLFPALILCISVAGVALHTLVPALILCVAVA
jgi:hypothetical protein